MAFLFKQKFLQVQFQLFFNYIYLHSFRWENLHQACNLVAEYRTCIGGLVITGCTVAEAVNLWSIIELYTCQLIVPSVKEHQKCFAIARDTRCSFS